MSQIPEFVQQITTPLIAIVVAYIAYQQHHTNKLRLRMEMYDRRYAIYSSVLRGLVRIIQKGDADRKDWLGFLEHSNESHFLFYKLKFQFWKSDIPGYLQELMNECREVDEINLGLADGRKKFSDAERKRLNDRKYELIADLADNQSKRARDRFSDYLRMG